MLHFIPLEFFPSQKQPLIKKQQFMKKILCFLIGTLSLLSFKIQPKPTYTAYVKCVRISGTEIKTIQEASGRDKMKRIILRFSISALNSTNSQTTVQAFWVKKQENHTETREIPLTDYPSPRNCLEVINGEYFFGNNYVSVKRIEALLNKYEITGDYFLKFTPELDGRDVVFRMSVVKPDDSPYALKRAATLGGDVTNPSPPREPE